MAKREGQEKGSQEHAEGEHSARTHAEFIEDLHGRHGGSEESEGAPQDHSDEPIAGQHRLHEEREQHDEAENDSETDDLRG